MSQQVVGNERHLEEPADQLRQRSVRLPGSVSSGVRSLSFLSVGLNHNKGLAIGMRAFKRLNDTIRLNVYEFKR